MTRYAVIPSYGRECFYECLDAILPQVEHVYVIGHNFQPDLPADCTLIEYNVEVPNISTMWNLGIDAAMQDENAVVAVLNDDAIVGPDWFDRVSEHMATYGGVVGCMSPNVDRVHVQTSTALPLPRMEGFAFILNTVFGIRLDEQFQWWWGDTDLDWQARRAGGTVIIPGTFEHRFPNGTTTGILADIAGQDRNRFIDKWGSAPW